MSSVILVGAFIETIELCEQCGFRIEGIIDSLDEDEYYGYPVIGKDEDILAEKQKYLHIPLVIVPDSPRVREKLFSLYERNGFHFQTVISPKATVSKRAVIGEGCLIQDHCNISALARLGKGVRVNTCANIMHETVVQDFATIAPNAVALGRCEIGRRAYIGANATILPQRIVYDDAVVGAASVVTKDVLEETVVAGNPARKLKRVSK